MVTHGLWTAVNSRPAAGDGVRAAAVTEPHFTHAVNELDLRPTVAAVTVAARADRLDAQHRVATARTFGQCSGGVRLAAIPTGQAAIDGSVK